MPNRFLTEILPRALIELQQKRDKIEREQWETSRKLDYDDQWSDHDCDCEYCESRDFDFRKRISEEERKVLQERYDEQEALLKEVEATIITAKSYKQFMENRKNGKTAKG